MIKIASLIGARPQIIKAAPVTRKIASRRDIEELIIHTGQHFSGNMSDIFIRDLMVLKPGYNLKLNRLEYGTMIGRMITGLEGILKKECPDVVLVYGDTNSTLAGALAAKNLGLKIAHVEAGLRSYDTRMPEEINRVLTDRMSDILFCPTDRAVNNLKSEGFGRLKKRIVNSGDIMKEAHLFCRGLEKKPAIEVPDDFVLATVHRAENTDDPDRLRTIFRALNRISREQKIIMPLHPRTAGAIKRAGIKTDLKPVAPVGYLEMAYLLKRCSLVMTDSGGLQKEAFFFKRPCVTLRACTEWTELVDGGFNLLAGGGSEAIYEGYKKMCSKKLVFNKVLYGSRDASEIIIRELKRI